MGIQSKTDADTELQEWYAARRACQAGSSFTVVTSAGTRQVTKQDLEDIEMIIAKLERIVGAPEDTGNKQGRHDFALANFNNEAQS